MKINVKFTETNQCFTTNFADMNESFGVSFENLTFIHEKPDFDYYSGSYKVTPKVSEQVLETKQKIMESDLVVKEIPYFDTSNTAGGTTIYIGDSIEDEPSEEIKVVVTDDNIGNVTIEGVMILDDGFGNITMLKANGESILDKVIQ